MASGCDCLAGVAVVVEVGVGTSPLLLLPCCATHQGHVDPLQVHLLDSHNLIRCQAQGAVHCGGNSPAAVLQQFIAGRIAGVLPTAGQSISISQMRAWGPAAGRSEQPGAQRQPTTHLNVLAKSLLDFARSLDRLDSARSIANAAAAASLGGSGEELKGAHRCKRCGRMHAGCHDEVSLVQSGTGG